MQWGRCPFAGEYKSFPAGSPLLPEQENRSQKPVYFHLTV